MNALPSYSSTRRTGRGPAPCPGSAGTGKGGGNSSSSHSSTAQRCFPVGSFAVDNRLRRSPRPHCMATHAGAAVAPASANPSPSAATIPLLVRGDPADAEVRAWVLAGAGAELTTAACLHRPSHHQRGQTGGCTWRCTQTPAVTAAYVCVEAWLLSVVAAHWTEHGHGGTPGGPLVVFQLDDWASLAPIRAPCTSCRTPPCPLSGAAPPPPPLALQYAAVGRAPQLLCAVYVGRGTTGSELEDTLYHLAAALDASTTPLTAVRSGWHCCSHLVVAVVVRNAAKFRSTSCSILDASKMCRTGESCVCA